MTRFGDPRRLLEDDARSEFDCGVRSLNDWLIRHAWNAALLRSAKTFVVCDEQTGKVAGYAALTAASISHVEATARVKEGMPRHRIPAILIARLAVDGSVQGKGLGAFLLADALKRSVAASQQAAVRLVLVHAIDQKARSFYERFGFESSPTDGLNLQLPLQDVRESIKLEKE